MSDKWYIIEYPDTRTFIFDEDSGIPITQQEYFEDDIVNRFTEIVKLVYGEENLDFIANALGNNAEESTAAAKR